MPTLREFLRVLCEGQDLEELERRARERWPEQRIYVPPAGSRKRLSSAGDVTEIVQVAREIGVTRAARRYGLSRMHVSRLVRRS